MRRSLIKNKKAQLNQFSIFGIFAFMITALVVVLFFAGLIYIQGLLANIFHTIGVQNEINYGNPNALYVNMSAASDQIWGQLNTSIQSLKMVAGVYILALAAMMIITNALVKIHPMWFFAYILIALLAIVFSVPISNAYQQLLASAPVIMPDVNTITPTCNVTSNIYTGCTSTLQGFTVSNFILFNLPIVVLVLAVLGGIFLFINILRQEERGSFQ